MDVAISTFLLITLLPLLATIAALIKISSPGPIFYTHERIGRYGKKFKVIKFRSMVVNADKILEEYLAHNEKAREEWLATRKLKNDPRITRIGKFLRKYSLDELPQLWNVLKGEMSLVGPRPVARDELVQFYKKHTVYYILVRPGMTGLWQISGRSDTSYDERIQLDVHYVKNWTIFLDFKILLKTAQIVLLGKGAY